MTPQPQAKTPRSAMRGSRSAEAQAATTPPRRTAGRKREPEVYDSPPSPTIRQPKEKVTVLQLPPKPDVPYGNNEETLLPLYTPELGPLRASVGA